MSDEISHSEDPVESRDSASQDTSENKPRQDGGKGDAARDLDPPREYGGRKGPDPVRYGDWEKNGRCIDF